MVIYLPQPGAMLGAYKLVETIGQGGGGYVYKAMRGGRYFAVKVLNTLELDGWTRREITALVNLRLPNVVRFIGHDWWPEAERGYPCIIMEFISGLPLGTWAEHHNPSTRRALTIFFKIAKALSEVFRLGVLHRDIKESNIIIREYDGEPVLIDFGFSAVAGAPTVTGPGRLPPGTPEYRSPEAVRFIMGKTEEETYTYSLSDELWALGVVLYWLLTDVLPFGHRDEPGLSGRILTDSPQPPNVINRRVPEVVSRLCMRMLDKDPRARFQTHDELCTAVEALLSGAEGDASWDVPLIDPESPHHVTTVNADQPKNEQEKDIQQWIAHQPRRGRKPRGQPPAPPPPDKLPPVGELEGQEHAQPDAPGVAPGPNGKEEEAAAAQPPQVPAGPVADRAAPLVRKRVEARAAAEPAPDRAPGVRRWLVGTGAMPVGPLLLDLLKRPPLSLVAVLAVMALVGGSVGAWHWPAPSREVIPAAPLAKMAVPPPGASALGVETVGAASVREVAQPGNPSEAKSGAEPMRAQPPAPTPTAMARKETPRLNPEEKPTPQPQGKTSRCVPIRQWVCTAAGICSAVLAGCPGAEVRPTPQPVACPAGWQETHAKFGLGVRGNVHLQGYEGENTERAPVREGPVTVIADRVGKLPRGTLLYGTLQPGENRFYGTFTQVQIPGGESYPVCLVIGHDIPAAMPGGPDCPVGLGDCPAHESRPGNMKMFTRFDVFEKGSSYQGGFF